MGLFDKTPLSGDAQADRGYWQGSSYPDAHRQQQRAQATKAAKQAKSSASSASARMQEVLAPKDHVSAALLAIFLGWLGVHKFYLGYYQTGIVMMAISVIGSMLTIGLASAVMGVISFIEGIIYLSKSQSEFNEIYVAGHKDWF